MPSSDNNDSDDDASEQNSEFDSDASEQEMLLYTNLYFGNKEENVVNKGNNDNKVQEQATSVISISNSKLPTVISKNSDSTNENVLQNPDPKENTDKEIKEMTKTEKPKRIRNPSTCSIESISGKRPLDNLYCIDLSLDNPLDTVVEILDDEFKNLKNTNQNNQDISILPSPHPKQVETIMLESENSNSSIEVVKCSKRKKKKSISPKKKKKSIQKQILCISSDSHPSDSEDDNLDVSSVPIIFKLGSKIISTKDKDNDKEKTIKKNISKSSVYAKCSVIYSKDRPLTKKQPSCLTWTKEMASLYDSDYSDEFSVEDIYQMQNSDPKYWKICSEDRQILKNKKRRYYEPRCVRCKDYGHTVNQCSRVPHCRYCSATDHQNVNHCPQNCCLRCGKSPHGFCRLTTRAKVCEVCEQQGHVSSLCPDLWRRFHATTTGTVPVIPDENQQVNKHIPYCYNCAKKGHYGHECGAYRANGNVPIRMNYLRVSTEIFSYESLATRKTKEAEVVSFATRKTKEAEVVSFATRKTKEAEVVSVESDSELDKSAEKQIKYSDHSVMRDEITSTPPNKKTLLQTVPLTKAQYNLLSSKKNYFLKEIKMASIPPVDNMRLGKIGDNLNLNIRGTKQAIESVVDFTSMVLNKSPLKTYKKFMKNIKTKKKLLKKKSQLEKIEKEDCVIDVEFSDSKPNSVRTPNINSTLVTSATVSSKIKSADDDIIIITENISKVSDTNFKNTRKGDCITPKNCKAVDKNSRNTPYVAHFNDSVQVITDLPVSLPRSKPEALAVFDQLFMRMEPIMLKNYSQCAVNYFDKHSINEQGTIPISDSLKYRQALARIVFIQKEDPVWWVRKLASLNRELEQEQDTKINVNLYNQITNYYNRISNPTLSKLDFLLRFTKPVLRHKS